jgi:hypothetical protein
MHAKASIPAWAKLLAISVGAVAIIALLVAAPWRAAERGACMALLENIELVQSGAQQRRVSRAFRFRQRRTAAPRQSRAEGDFTGPITLDGVRSCLGSEWVETHASAQYEAFGDAWVFTRAGGPLVMYVQSRSDQYRSVEMMIIIERAE